MLLSLSTDEHLQIQPAWRDAMNQLSEYGRVAYRQFVYETDGFLDYWQAATHQRIITIADFIASGEAQSTGRLRGDAGYSVDVLVDAESGNYPQLVRHRHGVHDILS